MSHSGPTTSGPTTSHMCVRTYRHCTCTSLHDTIKLRFCKYVHPHTPVAQMPALEGGKKEKDVHRSLGPPAPESPFWLPNLSAPRGASPNSTTLGQHTQQLQHQHPGQTWRPGHTGKPLMPHTQGGSGKFAAMPKTRDLPSGYLTRSPHDASGLFSLSTLPNVEVPGMRNRKTKVRNTSHTPGLQQCAGTGTATPPMCSTVQ